MRSPRPMPRNMRGAVPINFPPEEDLPMNARSKLDDPDFRIGEYIGVEEVTIGGKNTPSGRTYHFGEDPEEIKYAIHIDDLNYLKAVGLIRMRSV